MKTNKADKAGLYVHIPFCLRKCLYCDFFSKSGSDENLQKEYVQALIREMEFYGSRQENRIKADTVFLGGGTPSIMKPALTAAVIEALRKNFDIDTEAEITIECNPATLTKEKLEEYRKDGINRLSIGAQSFDDDVLKRLGRVHSSQDIIQTVRMARKAGFGNINIDLMFAVPGLDMNKWKASMNKTLELEPEHLSFYSLEIAEGTPFGEMLRQGILEETPVETDRSMYHWAMETIDRAGYDHYEISNAAAEGRKCRHNMKYWTFGEYMGFGASAHSFMGGVRYSNICDVGRYISSMSNQDMSWGESFSRQEHAAADCTEMYHVNSFEDSASEYVFTALRTKEGVILEDFRERFGSRFWDVYGRQRGELESFVRSGHVISDSRHIALTGMGIDISNRIMAIFV